MCSGEQDLRFSRARLSKIGILFASPRRSVDPSNNDPFARRRR